MHALFSFPDLINGVPPFAFHRFVLDPVRAGGQAFVVPV
jgi:hypothetical protein